MLRRLAAFLVTSCLLFGSALADGETLRSLALLLGLEDAYGFAETVETLRREGDLPAYYVTKSEARDLGWRPGDDLCRTAPGRVIGGDRFGNREGRLPDRRGRRWYEADLDFDCGRRGAHRLVFSSDGLIFVTVDHYETFYEIPAEATGEEEQQ
ncbi:MAG: ribonuclease domain-containing protein [Geminicoccaceae bacterium]